ncbi:hypothetical protein ACQKII_22675 [Lysinibacillus sp. NPDC048646]|uniref:hypothetical protein n=1 Tax=Lysinibacillus sp. NPDC048646 TaxID=3390574 RepID=UPI003CFCF18A
MYLPGLSGILLAITPIVSQLVDAKRAVQQGLYVAIVIVIIIFILLITGIDRILGIMQLEVTFPSVQTGIPSFSAFCSVNCK